MRRINLNVTDLVNAINGDRPRNMPVGHGRDVHGHFYTVFLGTDQETGEPTLAGKDKDRHVLNFRPSKQFDKDTSKVNVKVKTAATPGEVLTNDAGTQTPEAEVPAAQAEETQQDAQQPEATQLEVPQLPGPSAQEVLDQGDTEHGVIDADTPF